MKKTTAKKLKMKKMFAAVQTIADREDPEDSIFEVIGVYSSKKTAQAELEKAKQKSKEQEALTQFQIRFDDDTAFKEEEKEKPVINPDRTQKKIQIKREEADDIRQIKAKRVNKNAKTVHEKN